MWYRSTTTYLVQRRIDMLPKPLTEDICSLRGGVERLAFSVIWEMTPQADAMSVRSLDDRPESLFKLIACHHVIMHDHLHQAWPLRLA